MDGGGDERRNKKQARGTHSFASDFQHPFRKGDEFIPILSLQSFSGRGHCPRISRLVGPFLFWLVEYWYWCPPRFRHARIDVGITTQLREILRSRLRLHLVSETGGVFIASFRPFATLEI